MGFEWDEAKRRENLDKHGVDFVRAAKVFRNVVFEAIDDRERYGEVRIKALGHWKGDFTCGRVHHERAEPANRLGLEGRTP